MQPIKGRFWVADLLLTQERHRTCNTIYALYDKTDKICDSKGVEGNVFIDYCSIYT